MSDYNYDIQGAFYLDSAQADKLLFIACCKTNGKVFHGEFPADSLFIKEGRRKYIFILKKGIQQNLFEKIYALRAQAALREKQELEALNFYYQQQTA